MSKNTAESLRIKLVQALKSRGMLSDNHINGVMTRLERKFEEASIDIDLDNSYPEAVEKVTLIKLLDEAKEYIKENCPQAFFRTLFFAE